MHIYIYIHIYTYIHIYISTYVYIYTYIHVGAPGAPGPGPRPFGLLGPAEPQAVFGIRRSVLIQRRAHEIVLSRVLTFRIARYLGMPHIHIRSMDNKIKPPELLGPKLGAQGPGPRARGPGPGPGVRGRGPGSGARAWDPVGEVK